MRVSSELRRAEDGRRGLGVLRVEGRAQRLARGVGRAALRVDGGVETVPGRREPHNWRRSNDTAEGVPMEGPRLERPCQGPGRESQRLPQAGGRGRERWHHQNGSIECPMPNAQCPIPKFPHAQCPMPNTQCPMLNAQCLMPNAQCPHAQCPLDMVPCGDASSIAMIGALSAYGMGSHGTPSAL